MAIIPILQLENLRLKGQYLRIDRIGSLAQDCLTEIPYLNHHSTCGELFGSTGPGPQVRLAIWTRPSLDCQAQGLTQELSGLFLRRGPGKVGLAVAEDQFFASIIAAVFGPETQETVDNLHHFLLQSWVVYLIFECLNFLIYKTEIRGPPLTVDVRIK